MGSLPRSPVEQRQPQRLMNMSSVRNPFAYASNFTTIQSKSPTAYLKHGNVNEGWHDGEPSDYDDYLHNLEHLSNPDKKHVRKFKPPRIMQTSTNGPSTGKQLLLRPNQNQKLLSLKKKSLLFEQKFHFQVK